MSEAPTPSSSSTTFADIPLDDNKTSKILAENPSPPSDSNSNSNSNSPQESPPSDGQSPPSPDSSQNPTPPPSDSSSSPSPLTTGSNTPPSDSPPPDSNSSTPSDSGGSSPPPPPPPSDNSNSDSSPPPPPDSDSSNSSPPSDSQSSPPPPPPSDSNSPPPKGDTPSPPAPPPDSTVAKPPPNDQSSSPSPDKSSSPPKSPPKESSPPPTESKASPPAPTQPLAPLPKTPVTPNSPPQSHDSPPAPTSDSRSPPADNTPSVPTPPGSKSSQHVPVLTPPSRDSDSSSYTPPPSRSSGSSTGGVAGATLAGIVIIAFVAIFFVVVRKKKKRANAYPGYFGPPPPNYSGSADGYYYAQHSQQHSLPPNSQQHAIGIAGQSNEFYSGPSTMGNGHGSYRAPESGVIAGGLSCFSYEELMGITSGFARQNVIGEGGFGSVYKGFLTDGRAVAVKELKAGSGQGEREFRAEVEIISRVHHRHLVSLVGYCIADSHRLLVYEFVSNNTLEHHLHGEGVPVMEWSKRMKIAVGSARGLAYLHEDCHPKIIHRDIKSANILIDDDYEAQVADFGLAKLSDDISAHVSTRVMGTFGYLAPEYAASGKLSDKSDVFSFGVVLLEIVTGRKPVDGSQPLGDESLVEWARPLLTQALETGDFSELVDPRLGNRYVEDEMLRMITAASASVRHSAPKRPRMVQVLRALDIEGDMPDLTNGVKVGQSTIFQAGQNVSDMQKFRMMAFGSEDSSEYQIQSSEYQMKTGNFTSGEAPRRPRPGDTGAVEFSSGELETRAINPRSNRRL